MIKKNIITSLILIIVLIDAAIGFLLVKNRLFSHLAAWEIKESSNISDFYKKPKNAPLVGTENNKFNKVIEIARSAMDLHFTNPKSKLRLKWDSPEGMIKQIKNGAQGHCFHGSILFSAYLSGAGIESRLWALENKRFDATPHTINEVYVRELGKWVFMDITHGFYITENGNPLSFLEFRERLLNGKAGSILVNSIQDSGGKKKELSTRYKDLVKSVFLRSGDNFVSKYKDRYGAFSVFASYIDMLPDNFRLGINYFLGRRDVFMHYVDKYSGSVAQMIFIAKAIFYCFIFLAILELFLIALSIKETRHK